VGASKGAGGGGEAKADAGEGSKTAQIARGVTKDMGVDAAAAAMAPGGSVDKGREAFPSIPGLDLDRAITLARSAATNAVAIGTALAEAKTAFDPNDALSALFRAEAAALNGAIDVDALNEAIPGGMKGSIDKLGSGQNIPPKLTAALRALSAATKRTAALAGAADIRQFGLLEAAGLVAMGRIKSMGSVGTRVKVAIEAFSAALGEEGTPLALLGNAVSALKERDANAERKAIRQRNADAREKEEGGASPSGKAATKEAATKETKPIPVKEAEPAAGDKTAETKDAAFKAKFEAPELEGYRYDFDKIGETFEIDVVALNAKTANFTLTYIRGDRPDSVVIARGAALDTNKGDYETQEATVRTKMYAQIDKTLGKGMYNPNTMSDAVEKALAAAGNKLMTLADSRGKKKNNN